MVGVEMWHSVSTGAGLLRICTKISWAGGTVEGSGSIVAVFCGRMIESKRKLADARRFADGIVSGKIGIQALVTVVA